MQAFGRPKAKKFKVFERLPGGARKVEIGKISSQIAAPQEKKGGTNGLVFVPGGQ
jgi:hypothetical protein